ncbi:hypothetical protein I5R65_16765 [Herbaspirillum sp. AP02]|uniref:hypothetical protein n=1 Tax=unclassified Herbaspirillum TaxID=2624150 RepID=UPI0015D9AEE5|nr:MULTISPECIES: hypothetical protein [unclassified Herbaspirillum]MBG7621120.1 hypothetical protein [Herbaspirillum sp. AP02]NZD68849.1 hypothetical protein [Herbaspirillum sp. AP21]
MAAHRHTKIPPNETDIPVSGNDHAGPKRNVTKNHCDRQKMHPGDVSGARDTLTVDNANFTASDRLSIGYGNGSSDL